jgi:uncharacterized Tic20 family protein
MNSEQLHSLVEQQGKNRSGILISLLIILSLLMTLVMIGLSVALKNYVNDTDTASLITSFLAGMFGYAALEFLRRGFQKI